MPGLLSGLPEGLAVGLSEGLVPGLVAVGLSALSFPGRVAGFVCTLLSLSTFPEVPAAGRVTVDGLPDVADVDGLLLELTEGRVVVAGFDWVAGRVADVEGFLSELVDGRVVEDFLFDELERLTDLPDDFLVEVLVVLEFLDEREVLAERDSLWVCAYTSD